MSNRFLSSLAPPASRALLLWTLREVPALLLDAVFEHDAEMRDRFLKDWSGEDMLVAAEWEMCAKSGSLRALENLLCRLTENGEQDVHWYALRPARLGDATYALFYVNFDGVMTPDAFTHLTGCLCAFCSRHRIDHDMPEAECAELASSQIM